MKTYYYIPNVWDKDDLDIDSAYEFNSNRDIYDANNEGIYDEWEVKWLIEEMADYYLHNQDGWELANTWCSNGLEFALWDSNKQFIGVYSVILEYEPRFMVYKE